MSHAETARPGAPRWDVASTGGRSSDAESLDISCAHDLPAGFGRARLLAMAHNPFATRWVRPGALAFEFPEGESLESVLRRWDRSGRRGAIVGPHGSGKSTLLAALAGRLAGDSALGHAEAPVVLKLGQRGACAPRRAGIGAARVVALDGFERLSAWRRWRWLRFCRSRGLGLLVTAHAPTALPTIFQTRPSLELAERLAARLLSGASQASREPVPALDDDYRGRLRQSFTAHRGDIREALFDMYDHYESRRSRSPQTPVLISSFSSTALTSAVLTSAARDRT